MNYDYTALFLASGMGLGALGFRNAAARLGNDTARFKILGGVDFDAGACADFEMLTGSRALQADLHDLTPADLRQYAGDRCPDAVFGSAPCKGFSRLLGAAKAAGPTYQRMNDLVYRCIMLSCETWDRPAPLIALENVPGIMSRGAKLLERCRTLLHHYGYHVHEGTHDCGEIGDLAQHRKRYLLVARQPKRVTAFVHKPPLHKVRACGDVLSQLPVPIGAEGASAGVLHSLPKIAWVTWVKLALIPAGGDHRDLPKDFALRIDPTKFGGSPGLYAVGDFERPFPTVTATASVTSSNGSAAVADPRVEFFRNVTRVESWEKYGVLSWEEAARTITGNASIDNGRFSAADPRKPPPGPLPVIISADECWHRPLTTLELGALQGLPTTLNGRPIELAGSSSLKWRERIGNAVPEGAGRAMGTSLLLALLASTLGTWFLSSEGIWVRQRDSYGMSDAEAYAS